MTDPTWTYSSSKTVFIRLGEHWISPEAIDAVVPLFESGTGTNTPKPKGSVIWLRGGGEIYMQMSPTQVVEDIRNLLSASPPSDP